MKKIIFLFSAILVFSSCQVEKQTEIQLSETTEPVIECIPKSLTDAQIRCLYNVVTSIQTRAVILVDDLTEFRTYLNSSVVAVYFGASWCGPCKMYRPIYFKVSDNYTAKTCRFLEVDTDSSPDIASAFEIRSIPTTIIIKDGQEVARATGVLQESALVNLINNYIQ